MPLLSAAIVSSGARPRSVDGRRHHRDPDGDHRPQPRRELTTGESGGAGASGLAPGIGFRMASESLLRTVTAASASVACT